MKSVVRPLVIVPTYNESENISALLDAILKEAPQYEILVVDDSSPDGTAKLVQKKQAASPKIHLLVRAKKEGLAAAYGAGFQWGIDRHFDVLTQMDADFSHEPKALPEMLKAIQHSDVVVGSRYIPGGKIRGWGWLRKCISRGGNIYARTLLGVPIKELTGGFNTWRTEVIQKVDGMHLNLKGYAFQVELKYKAYKQGFKILEIPITFENRVLGKSKMSGDIVWEAAIKIFQMRGS